MSPVLCFSADDETAKIIESLRIVHTKAGDIVLRPRSEILAQLIKLGLAHYDAVTDVERETTSPEHPNTVRSVSHTRSSKGKKERGTSDAARTADSK